jgi:hypothetical protein
VHRVYTALDKPAVSPKRPVTYSGWRADSVSAASAEAGREFDKLATYLTTPRDSLTREVNLVVSPSQTPPLITYPSPNHPLRSYDTFSLSVYRFRERHDRSELTSV